MTASIEQQNSGNVVRRFKSKDFKFLEEKWSKYVKHSIQNIGNPVNKFWTNTKITKVDAYSNK